MMIEITGVKPTASEVRPVRRGWGLVHWVACLPGVVLGGAIAALAVIAIEADTNGDTLDAVGLVLLAALILFAVSQAVVRDVMRSAAAKAPGGEQACDWTFSREGVRFVTPFAKSQHDWAAIRSVREEKDRFVLLMAPGMNPVLPKRCLDAEQATALRALVAEMRTAGRLV